MLDQLRRDGPADNTMVVFFGDNGRREARGIRRVWITGLLVPMIIPWNNDVWAIPG